MLIAVGETRYGKSDLRPDGSYVTIEWFHICTIPIYPLRRVRVKPHYGRELIEELPRSMSAIMKTYAFVLAYAAWFVAVTLFIFTRNSDYLNHEIGLWMAFVGFALAMLFPFGLLWLYRREAYRARYRSKELGEPGEL